MKINDFIKNFSGQFEDANPSMFTSETRFRNLEEWSSLTALSVMAMMEEEYGVRLNGNDMRSAVTVGDLYNIVKARADE